MRVDCQTCALLGVVSDQLRRLEAIVETIDGVEVVQVCLLLGDNRESLVCDHVVWRGLALPCVFRIDVPTQRPDKITLLRIEKCSTSTGVTTPPCNENVLDCTSY